MQCSASETPAHSPETSSAEVSRGLAVCISVIEVTLENVNSEFDPLYSKACGRKLHCVPIFRIYGPTPSGQLCCLHVHGTFPYFYVPLPIEEYKNPHFYLVGFTKLLVKHADTLTRQRCGRRRARKGQSECINGVGIRVDSRSKRKRLLYPFYNNAQIGLQPLVYEVSLQRRIPFYGYHNDFFLFLRISVTIPELLVPLASSLLQGQVTGKPMQPYEVHIPYCMQVLADNGLRGMDYLFASRASFRSPLYDGQGVNLRFRKHFVLNEKGNITPMRGNCVIFRGNVRTSGKQCRGKKNLSGLKFSQHMESCRRRNMRRSLTRGKACLKVGNANALASLGWGNLLQKLEKASEMMHDSVEGRLEDDYAVETCFNTVESVCKRLLHAPEIIYSDDHDRKFGLAVRYSKCEIEADIKVRDILNFNLTNFRTRKSKIDDRLVNFGHSQSKQKPGDIELNNAGYDNRQNRDRTTHLDAINDHFSARLLESVSDFWEEEAFRCECLEIEFPYPPLNKLTDPALRDRYAAGDAVNDLWRHMLSQIVERVGQEKLNTDAESNGTCCRDEITSPKFTHRDFTAQSATLAHIDYATPAEAATSITTNNDMAIFVRNINILDGSVKDESCVREYAVDLHEQLIYEKYAGYTHFVATDGCPTANFTHSQEESQQFPSQELPFDQKGTRITQSKYGRREILEPANNESNCRDSAATFSIKKDERENMNALVRSEETVGICDIEGVSPLNKDQANSSEYNHLSSATAEDGIFSSNSLLADMDSRASDFGSISPCSDRISAVSEPSKNQASAASYESSQLSATDDDRPFTKTMNTDVKGERLRRRVTEAYRNDDIGQEGITINKELSGEFSFSARSSCASTVVLSPCNGIMAVNSDSERNSQITREFSPFTSARNSHGQIIEGCSTHTEGKPKLAIINADLCFLDGDSKLEMLAPEHSSCEKQTVVYSEDVGDACRFQCDPCSNLNVHWCSAGCKDNLVFNDRVENSTARPTRAKSVINNPKMGLDSAVFDSAVVDSSTQSKQSGEASSMNFSQISVSSSSANNIISISSTPAFSEIKSPWPVQQPKLPFFSNILDAAPGAMSAAALLLRKEKTNGKLINCKAYQTALRCSKLTVRGTNKIDYLNKGIETDQPSATQQIPVQQESSSIMVAYLRKNLSGSSKLFNDDSICLVYSTSPPLNSEVIGSCGGPTRQNVFEQMNDLDNASIRGKVFGTAHTYISNTVDMSINLEGLPTMNAGNAINGDTKNKQTEQLSGYNDTPCVPINHIIDGMSYDKNRKGITNPNLSAMAEPCELVNEIINGDSMKNYNRKSDGIIVASAVTPQNISFPTAPEGMARKQFIRPEKIGDFKSLPVVNMCESRQMQTNAEFHCADNNTSPCFAKTKKYGGTGVSFRGNIPSYATCMVIHVFSECHASSLAAVAAIKPYPAASRVAAICFCLRDERLQLETRRLASGLGPDQRHLIPTYTDVHGILYVDPLAKKLVSSTSKVSQDQVEVEPQGLYPFIPFGCQMYAASTEQELFFKFCELVALFDPTIILSWDGNFHGLGYLVKRSRVLGFGREFVRRVSRRCNQPEAQLTKGSAGGLRITKAKPFSARLTWEKRTCVTSVTLTVPAAKENNAQEPNVRDTSDVNCGTNCGGGRKRKPTSTDIKTISGRIILEGWRVLQKEMSLKTSTFEGVVFEMLGVSVPSIPDTFLTSLWVQAHERRWRGFIAQMQRRGIVICNNQTRVDISNCRSMSGPDTSISLQSDCYNDVGYREIPDISEELYGLKACGELINYLLNRVIMLIRLFDKSETISRACQLSRLYGCVFSSVLSRGSQFKVENVLIRATKRIGAVLVSPSSQQVTEQPTPVCIPLVMEPRSMFYWNPIVVLDFLSLYPSVMIAHNICYSTALGSVEVDPFENELKTFGVMKLHMPPKVFSQIFKAYEAYKWFLGKNGKGDMQDDRSALASQMTQGPIHVLPGGGMFVSKAIRQGVLPMLLHDILQTRLMVKQAMKQYKGCVDDDVMNLLNHRQFGLKMISNVVYGYTAANLSGRMPCSDLADAIVQTAKATLLRAMHLVDTNPRWSARVVYGDTDSLFVLLEGRSVGDAFKIGNEIVEEVTRRNPAPIQLQLEKVYLPCCLLSKKRYVGMAYTSPTDAPFFDAKGIETVRRDQCPLTSGIIESTLREFFTTRDLSAVKQTLYRHWREILLGNVPIRQFIFCRKCKLGTYKAEKSGEARATLPAQAKVAYEAIESCGRDDAGPDYGERVSFVFAQSYSGDVLSKSAKSSSRLIDCATSPEHIIGARASAITLQELLQGNLVPKFRAMPFCGLSINELCEDDFNGQTLDLNRRYYIIRQIIPALDRLFSLLPYPVTVDLHRWFRCMPKPKEMWRQFGLDGSNWWYSGSAPNGLQMKPKLKKKLGILRRLGIKSGAGNDFKLKQFFKSTSCFFCGQKCSLIPPSEIQDASHSAGFSFNHLKPSERNNEISHHTTRRNHSRVFMGASDESCMKNCERSCLHEPPSTKPIPICKTCANKKAEIASRCFVALKEREQNLAASDSVCTHCAGSRLCATGCTDAWHCDIYFKRIEDEAILQKISSQMRIMRLFTD